MEDTRVTEFSIAPNQPFEHLPHAPIVEAVIHWQSRAQSNLAPDDFLQQLKCALPEYPNLKRQHEVHLGAEVGPEGSSLHHRQDWQGFRFASDDSPYIAQFTRNGLVFSRLAPYESWERFAEEGLRLWRIYREHAQPSEIQRLGVRFINAIGPVQINELNGLLSLAPQSPPGMPLVPKQFLYQNTYEIPNYPYNLNVVRTIQPLEPTADNGFRLILDLDVFTTKPLAVNDEATQDALAEMRWIKNKAFFALLTDQAIARFR
jgi:uncharacterized protein (TIGR04255 family)